MTNIIVGRYPRESVMYDVSADGTETPCKRQWQGWIEDEDRTWIAFIDADGRPVFFLDRCKECGGILTEDHPSDMAFYCYHRDPETGDLVRGCHEEVVA